MRRVITAFAILVTCACALQAQQSSPSGLRARSVRIGIAMPLNESRFSVTSPWARDQVIRNLKTLQTDRMSPIILEPMPLESQLKDKAVEEGAAKHCVYVLLTKIQAR